MRREANFRIIYDRRKKANNDHQGLVEIEVFIDRYHRKYVSTGVWCYPWEWRDGAVHGNQNDEAMNARIIGKMRELQRKASLIVAKCGSRITPAQLYESMKSTEHIPNENMSLITYILTRIEERNLADGTKRRHRVLVDALIRHGKMKMMKDITLRNLISFDDFIKKEGGRCQSTIHGYHAILSSYLTELEFRSIIPESPYKHFKSDRGRCRERRPLNEQELMKLRAYPCPSPMHDKARDLFVFSCYTGLAYVDVQSFNFTKHAVEKSPGKFYIDGARLKTGSRFFTPILPPALEVLQKYQYKLPSLSNQKMNLALHDIEAALNFTKPLTSHVARHTFATLTLSKSIPIEVVQRMMGHTDIKTTQIYAKILEDTVADAVDDALDKFM